MDKLLEVREFDTITGNADFENNEKYKPELFMKT